MESYIYNVVHSETFKSQGQGIFVAFDALAGERLKEERARLNFSQVGFADKAGIRREMLSRYERAVAEPGAGSLIAMAEAGVDVLYVLTGERAGTRKSLLAPAEDELLTAWRNSSDKGRALLLAAVDVLRSE